MTDSRTQSQLDRDRPQLGHWLALCFVWALINAGAVGLGISPVLDGGLLDTDSYMRLVRVDLLYQTGAWYDGNIPRSNAPYGDILHWTRLFDAVLLCVAWLLTPVLGFEKALFWGGSFISPVLWLASAFAIIWASKPLIDRDNRPYIIVAFLAQLAVMAYSLPGRVDHHTLLIFLLVLTMGLVLRLCTGRPKGAVAVLTGVILGIGLWGSIEFMLAIFLAVTAIWLSWLRYGRERSLLAASLAAGLAGSVALALLIERPLGAIWAVEYDRISIFHLTVVLAHLLFWALVLLGERVAGNSLALRGRLVGSLLGALAGATLIFVAYPNVFDGAMAGVDPEIERIYLSKIKELQPILPTDSRTFGRFLFWVGPAVICLPFVLGLVWIKRRENAWLVWAYFALALGLYLALSLRHVRFAPYAEVMSVVPLVYLIVVLRRRLDWIVSKTWRDIAQSLVSLVLIIGISGTGLILGYRPSPGTQAAMFAVSGASAAGTGKCDIGAIADFLNKSRSFGDRPRIIATHVDFGPELLYRTEHAVVGSPYHRNTRGILDIHRIFSATDGAESRALLDARRAELVLLCPSPRETLLYSSEAEGDTFYERLLNGRVPEWMQPVVLPGTLGAQFRLYRVLP